MSSIERTPTTVDLTQPPLPIPRQSWPHVLATCLRRAARPVAREFALWWLERSLRGLRKKSRRLRDRRDLCARMGWADRWVEARREAFLVGVEIEEREEAIDRW